MFIKLRSVSEKKEISLYLVKYIGLENMQKGVQRNFKRVLV